jgi:hypothetical protein
MEPEGHPEPREWQFVAAGGRKNADAALVLALAAGNTAADAARQAGVSERTAFRRLADPGFRRRVTEARADMVSRGIGTLAAGMAGAADTLRKLLTAGTGAVQLGAARAILELSVKLRESAEFEARLAALEDSQYGQPAYAPSAAGSNGHLPR